MLAAMAQPVPTARTDVPPAELVDTTEVSGDAGFPPRVTLQILTADGQVQRFVLAPVHAHKLSDDLLRTVAQVRPRD